MAKILLVEDDNNLREIYEARLQAEGYQIVSAQDGEQALVIAKAEKPDLVISDVMMPKISGFEMLDILRNTDELKGVKVIMLTALGQSDDQQRADKLGADRYLVKSQVTLEDIVNTAHELLGDQADDPSDSADTGAAADTGDAPAAAPAPAPSPTPSASPSPAPAPAPEPPAEPAPAAPAPSPAPAAPAPAPEKAPADDKPKADDNASKEAAEPAAKEEAAVEAKIEDFVTGATSEPTKPAEPAAAQPTAPTAADVKTDDKLMSDAVDALVASAGQPSTDTGDAGKPAPAGEAKPTSIPISIASDDKPDDTAKSGDAAASQTAEPAGTATAAATPDPAPSKDEPNQDEPDPDQSSQSEGSSKKVIKPLDSKPKKDINELLAEEEAKESQTVPGATIPAPGAGKAEPEDQPSGAPMAPPSSADQAAGTDPADPNSIAL